MAMRAYDESMSTGRITVSLPQRQIDAAKRAVAEAKAESVSAYVSAALDATYDSFDQMIADWHAEHGAPSTEAYAWAEVVVADAKRVAKEHGR